jgi:hypothetical protein
MMLRRIILLFWLLVAFKLSFAQIATNPALPIDEKAVILTFDSSKDSKLGLFTGDLYAHTGVIVEGSPDWKHVIGSWGDNTRQPKLTNKGGGIYEMQISPNILSYYAVLSSEIVLKLAMVFRSVDGKRQTNNLFVDVVSEGLKISISSPSAINIFEKNESFQFTAYSTVNTDLKIFQNNQEIASQSGTSITKTIKIPDSGSYWLKIKATQDATIKLDSVYVCIREVTPTETRPAGLQAGINYTDDQSATLVIYAPKKKYIFVTGDFNDWYPENTYQMKKDSDFFWLKIENLTPQKEYIFQYLIDGNLKIADPYTDKIADPYDDKYFICYLP